MTRPAPTELDRATAVTAAGDGAWDGEVDPGRFAGKGPNGGYRAAGRRLSAPVPAPTIDLAVHFRAPRAALALPAGEAVLAGFRSTTAADGFFAEDGELWTRDAVPLADSRRLALLEPLGRAAA